MSVLFCTSESDRLGLEAVTILSTLGHNTAVLGCHEFAPLVSAAIFTRENPRGDGLGCSRSIARLAAHRQSDLAPEWAQSALFPVAVRQPPQQERLKRLKASMANLAELLGNCPNLTKIQEIIADHAPWGELPTAADNFEKYRSWISNRCGVDPDAAGILHQSGRLTRVEQNELLNILSAEDALGFSLAKERGYGQAFIRAISKTEAFEFHNHSHRKIICELAALVRQQLIDSEHLALQPGSQTVQLVRCLLTAVLTNSEVRIVAPTCPAWAHDGTGYTFGTIHGDQKGICYEMMIEPLVRLCQFLATANISFKATVIVADDEAYDVHTKECVGCLELDEFVARVRSQTDLISSDLQQRSDSINATTFLSLVSRQEYERVREEQTLVLTGLLANDRVTQYRFRNILNLERRLYGRLCGEVANEIDPVRPSVAVQQEVFWDLLSHMVWRQLIPSVFPGTEICFVVQGDPFQSLYSDQAHVGWRYTRQGVF